MLKKSSIYRLVGMMGLLVVALAVTGAAFAQEAAPDEQRTRWGGGTITAVADDNFTVRTRRGQEVSVYVDAATQITDRDGQPMALADIAVGSRVLGAAVLRDDGQRYAVIVHVFPPRDRSHGRAAGTASQVAGDHFTLTGRHGRERVVYVDAGTQVFGPKQMELSYADIAEGDRVFVKGELREDGNWWATEIKVRRPKAEAAP